MKNSPQDDAMTTQDIVEKYSDMVYRVAFAYARNRTDADDIYQETFLRYFKGIRSFESEEHRKAWLIRVTINCAKKHLQLAWCNAAQPLDENCEQQVFDNPNEKHMDRALCGLKTNYRAAIHLFYYEDYSVAEIGKALGFSESHVRTLLTRARKQLRKTLKGDDND
ncbi:MAG: RNA polymerase sigma factor [Oscillospiraceae bacterium]